MKLLDIIYSSHCMFDTYDSFVLQLEVYNF